MERRVRIVIGCLLLAALALSAVSVVRPQIWGQFYLRPGDVHHFESLTGPDTESRLADQAPTPWQDYADGSRSRLAILLTDPDSAWLGLVHGLKAIGVPLLVTRDPHRAIQHQVVLAYPMIAGSVLAPEELRELAAYVQNGGTLLAVNVLGGGLNEVFGFDDAVPTRNHTEVSFVRDQSLTTQFTQPRERTIRIGNPSAPQTNMGTYNYSNPSNVLASYEDNTAAIVWRKYDHGRAYAFGFDIGFLILQAHNFRLQQTARDYANGFEPTLDVILRLIKTIYRQAEPNAFTLYTVPHNHALAAVITHDIDYNRSLANAVEYARQERATGIPATHFLQTKYVRDWNDESFFDTDSVHHLRKLIELGVEVGSHSVSHSVVFRDFPLGDGTERYPDYVPFVRDAQTTYAGSIFGELRVSKFLLDQLSGGAGVVSFRAGHLENPVQLPQALAATGFHYDSTVTANSVLTHLPYRLNYDRGLDQELPVYEFPIAIEDELPPKLGQRLGAAIDLAHSIARYGGSFVVLMHPNEVGEKLEFQTRLIEAIKPMAWFGSLSDYGQWWAARDQVNVDVEVSDHQVTVNLVAPIAIDGLVLEMPDDRSIVGTRPQGLILDRQERRLILRAFVGDAQLIFSRTATP